MTMPEAAIRVEILNGIHRGPARVNSGSVMRLDYDPDRKMNFYVDVVFADGARLTLHDDPSYEAAIIEAEEAARDWKVAVHDLVAAP